MAVIGVGIDTVEIARMREILREDTEQFMQNTFTEHERAYCDRFADPAPHYAGTFAAKEASRKATGDLTRPFNAIEVIRSEQGKPELWCDGSRVDALHLSITHTHTDATAIVIFSS